MNEDPKGVFLSCISSIEVSNIKLVVSASIEEAIEEASKEGKKVYETEARYELLFAKRLSAMDAHTAHSLIMAISDSRDRGVYLGADTTLTPYRYWILMSRIPAPFIELNPVGEAIASIEIDEADEGWIALFLNIENAHISFAMGYGDENFIYREEERLSEKEPGYGGIFAKKVRGCKKRYEAIMAALDSGVFSHTVMIVKFRMILERLDGKMVEGW